jgi:hypothetical protein
MSPFINQWGPVAVIVGGYLVGIFSQNSRFDDLRETMNKRFDDLHDLLKLEVKRIEDRLERPEHPLVRQS